MRGFMKALLLKITIGLLVSQFSMVSAAEVGHREECRQAMVGSYLNLFDSVSKLSGMLILMSESQQKYTKELSSIRKEFIKEKKRYEDEEFSEERENKYLALKYNFDFSREHLEFLKNALAHYKNEIPLAKKRLVDLERDSKDLFKVTMHADRGGTPYPFEIDFEQECPKFRFTCPLSTKQANLLRNLMSTRSDFKDACLPYLGYSGFRSAALSH